MSVCLCWCLCSWPQCRKPALGANTSAAADIVKAALVLPQLRAVGFGVPQMQHAGRHAAVLAADARAHQADEQVGILATPAHVRTFEAVDSDKVRAPDAE